MPSMLLKVNFRVSPMLHGSTVGPKLAEI